MGESTVKLVSGFILGVVALCGSILARYTAALSPRLVRVCNAGAGGVLLAVVLVHMLAENAESLGDAGAAIYTCLTGKDEGESFPLGFALCGLGFLANLSMEVFVPDSGHKHADDGHDVEDDDSETASSDAGEIMVHVDHQQSCAGSFSALFGLCLHSLIEGTAAGSERNMGNFDSTFIAIIAHKGFATFSAGSLMLGSVPDKFWWFFMVLLALMTPAGIILGMELEQSFEGPETCALVCFTSGCLLCIATYDMLMPAFLTGNNQWRRRSFVVSLLCFCLMSLLAVWS